MPEDEINLPGPSESSEIPIVEQSFLGAKAEADRLSRLTNPTVVESGRLAAARFRMRQLVEEVRRAGVLGDIDEDLSLFESRFNTLTQMSGSGDLKTEHVFSFQGDVQNARVRAQGLTESDENSIHKGIREFVYKEGLKEIGKKAERLVGNKQPKLEVPATLEDQRSLARSLLDKIEGDDIETYDFKNVGTLNAIEEVAAKLRPEIRAEISARLKLQDCFIAVKNVLKGGVDSVGPDGKPQTGGALREKVAQLSARNRLLEGEDFQSLFHLPGIDVSGAFEALQRAALYGVEIKTKDRNGREIVVKKKIYEKGTSVEEEKQIRKKIIEELGGGKEAEKAFQLATRYARASLETSVWNNDLLGIDPLAEAMYLRSYRQGQAQEGKDRGPDETVRLIEGFGSSFTRLAVDKFKQPLYNNDLFEITDSDLTDLLRLPLFEGESRVETVEHSHAVFKYLRRTRGRVLEKDKFLIIPENLNFLNLEPEAYGTYLSVRIPQILAVKNLLLKDDWKPDDVLPDQIRRWMGPLEFVDPKGYLGLKHYLLTGVFASAFRTQERAIQLEWGYTKLRNAIAALTDVLGRDERTGKEIRFFPRSELNRILRWVGAENKASMADAQRAVLGIR